MSFEILRKEKFDHIVIGEVLPFKKLGYASNAILRQMKTQRWDNQKSALCLLLKKINAASSP